MNRKKKIEIATLYIYAKRFGLEETFLKIWDRKSFRRLLNFPRRIMSKLRYRHLILSSPDAGEIESIVHDLKENGCAISHISNFSQVPKIDDLQKEFSELMSKHNPNTFKNRSKKYIERLVDDNYDFKAFRDKPFSQYVTHPSLALVAEGYLGLVPKLSSFKIWRSHFTGEVKRNASQNWHRDYNEYMMLRVFLYLNEVDEHNGAGEYIKDSHYLGNSYNILEYSEESGTYASDQEISDNFSQESIFIARGEPGTIIFLDTAGLHRGGYHPRPGERRVALITFSTAADIMPSKIFL